MNLLKSRFFKILSVILASIFITSVFMGAVKKEEIESGISSKVLRLHVRAKSNSADDQSLKLKVRDNVLAVSEEILADCQSKEESMEKIKENFAEEFSKELPSANNILDNKAAETGVQREQVMRLEKQVENLQAAVEKSSRPAEREEIILKVSEERAKSVKTEIIDGVRYVMIPAETGVKMKVNDREFE